MVLEYSVNWIAVIVAAVVGFIVSFIWWGPVFGKKWAKLSSLKMDKKSKEGMGGKMVIAFIAQIVMAYVLYILMAAVGGSVFVLSFWIWLGFVATLGVGIVLWNGKPWALFWLNSVGWLVTIEVMALALSFF